MLIGNASAAKSSQRSTSSISSPAKKKDQNVHHSSLPWTEKYRPKNPTELVGNQSLVCLLIQHCVIIKVGTEYDALPWYNAG